MSGQKALFLDRDGTINVDHVYINNPRYIELIPRAAEAIARAQTAGYKIIVVSNQSGVGRGIINPRVLPDIHARLDELLWKAAKAKIDSYQLCIHRPEDDCDCRKPLPKLVRDSARQFGIDLQQSAFVGDKFTDVATGQAAGCAYNILVRTGKGTVEESLASSADYVADDLSDAVDWILASSKKRSSRA